MKIGLNFDGVVTDFAASRDLASRLLFKIRLSSKYSDEELLAKGVLSHEQYQLLRTMIFKSSDLGLRIIPNKHCLSTLQQFAHKGWSYKIISQREGQAAEIARAWLKSQGQEPDFVSWSQDGPKADFMSDLDVYIDHDLRFLSQLIQLVPRRYLMSCSYNQKHETRGIAIRVNDWPSFYYRLLQTELY